MPSHLVPSVLEIEPGWFITDGTKSSLISAAAELGVSWAMAIVAMHINPNRKNEVFFISGVS
jgi:hypothetical protein